MLRPRYARVAAHRAFAGADIANAVAKPGVIAVDIRATAAALFASDAEKGRCYRDLWARDRTAADYSNGHGQIRKKVLGGWGVTGGPGNQQYGRYIDAKRISSPCCTISADKVSAGTKLSHWDTGRI
jgi:hypothetical protein